MNVHDAARLLEDGAAVAVDVREQAEWQAGRMPAALHIPMSRLAEHAGDLPRETTIVVVCRSGSRSSRVTHALRDAGYRAENLDGGMKAWARAGFPLDPADGRIA